MALYQERLAAFEYDREWISEGFAINPLSLPLEQRVFIPGIDPFDGIYGVFADSLPDGWGRLLVDRLMQKNHIDPGTMGNLERLAIVGRSGMGALSYEPDYHFEEKKAVPDLDLLAEECRKILNNGQSGQLDELFLLGGSSGGVRPKIFTRINGEEWIIKFPSGLDDTDIGRQEYDYSCCAKRCGIEMTKTHLFPSARCSGYFGTKRFDRQVDAGSGKERRIHMISASGLLETSHRLPNLDYLLLMRLTKEITKEQDELEKLFRLMCFNVFVHNRDDHSKNFSYLYNEETKNWHLAPAYDLTYSNSIGGEHATTVYGNGKNPGLQEILEVAKAMGMDSRRMRIIAEDIRECVEADLKIYLKNID